MTNLELTAMILYFIVVLVIGLYFFVRDKKSGCEGEKSFFLGNREMNAWVAALSAGASDMSAWVLMGLPGSIYLYGIGKVWISIGLLIGTICAWVFVAPRLRRYSIIADDSITIPQFLRNRFLSSGKSLQVISAIVFIAAYCVYAASSLYACGTLFKTVFNIDPQISMIVAAVIIMIYTFLGGYNAVCWTDFFQGMLMLIALMAAPIVACIVMNGSDYVRPAGTIPENFYSLFSGGLNWAGIATVLSGLGWGLGYFGMPHILVRYLSIKSEKEMKKSRVIGCVWIAVILLMASIVGILGRYFLGDSIVDDNSVVFINMVRAVFPAFIAGIFLSAILAASMSTADSQLLASTSAFASDVYKPILRKNASNKEMLWIGRGVVVLISIIAYLIARSPKCGGIMALVENAWGAFGAAFGPAILLALYWRRFTYWGAVAGIAVGFLADALWLAFLSSTGLYEIIPGFIAGLIACVVVSLLDKAPSAEVLAEFEKSLKPFEE